MWLWWLDFDDAVSLPSLRLQLTTVALCKRICDVYNIPGTSIRPLAAMRRTVREETTGSHATQQATLNRFLRYFFIRRTVLSTIWCSGQPNNWDKNMSSVTSQLTLTTVSALLSFSLFGPSSSEEMSSQVNDYSFLLESGWKNRFFSESTWNFWYRPALASVN